jgi:hypothetical protein
MGWDTMQAPGVAWALCVAVALIAMAMLGPGGMIAGALGGLVVRFMRRYKAQCPECQRWLLLDPAEVREVGLTSDLPGGILGLR